MARESGQHGSETALGQTLPERLRGLRFAVFAAVAMLFRVVARLQHHGLRDFARAACGESLGAAAES